jgi:hypothetical protein
MSYNVTPKMMQEYVSASKLKATEFVLAVRERELLAIKGPCSNKHCPLHYAHSGLCDEKADQP